MKSRYQGNNLSVILNGLDFCLFRKKEDYSIVAGRTVRLVQVSRLVHEIKGQDLLIKAVHEMNRRSGDFNYVVDFIGDGTSLGYLQSLCKNLSIEENIRFLGFCQSEWVNDNLCRYDILIQPSRIEGFGLTILEGVAAGIPVIASKIDGPQEIMNELPGNWQFAVDDLEGLIDQIEIVIDLYQKDQIGGICNDNCEVAQKKFSLKKTALSYLAEYAN